MIGMQTKQKQKMYKKKEDRIQDMVIELLYNRYTGICEENKMFFGNYKNICYASC